MEKKKVNEIMIRVITEWERRYGKDKIDYNKVRLLEKILSLSPHEDGFMRVTSLEDGKIRLVPFEKIILEGLHGKELDKFPIEKSNKRKSS